VEVLRVLASHPDLALRVRGEVAEADVTRLRRRPCSPLSPRRGRDRWRVYLEARRVGAAAPPPSRPSSTSAVAAAFLLEGWIDPDRIRVETSQLPAPAELATAPAVSIWIAGG